MVTTITDNGPVNRLKKAEAELMVHQADWRQHPHLPDAVVTTSPDITKEVLAQVDVVDYHAAHPANAPASYTEAVRATDQKLRDLVSYNRVIENNGQIIVMGIDNLTKLFNAEAKLPGNVIGHIEQRLNQECPLPPR